MIYGGLILLCLVISLVYSLYQFFRAGEKTIDAAQTAVYVVIYPFFVYVIWRAWPVPLWLLLPVVVAGIPWLVAGIHLNEIVKDPTLIRDDQFVGFPYTFWLWGVVLSVALGLWLE